LEDAFYFFTRSFQHPQAVTIPGIRHQIGKPDVMELFGTIVVIDSAPAVLRKILYNS
jgi:hypothetical protein